MNNDQSVNNDTPKVIDLEKAQNKRKRLGRQARPRINRKSAKKPKAKPGRVQRLRNRIERLETRLSKLRGRITLNEERLVTIKAKLEKAVSSAAAGKSQKKVRAKRAAGG